MPDRPCVEQCLGQQLSERASALDSNLLEIDDLSTQHKSLCKICQQQILTPLDSLVDLLGKLPGPVLKLLL